jgi:4-hydroxy-2-oxoheptanedioate aldolase
MSEQLGTILRNHMKEKLGRGEVVASMTVRFARSIEIAQIAKTAGFDTLYVDMEHNTLTLDATCQICIAAQQIGITPLVRVPANTPDYICRVLDGGAMGVITPHIRSAAEAKEMVDLVKFPPIGKRSAGGALSQYQYRSFPITETNAAMNEATTLVLMLETAAGERGGNHCCRRRRHDDDRQQRSVRGTGNFRAVRSSAAGGGIPADDRGGEQGRQIHWCGRAGGA